MPPIARSAASPPAREPPGLALIATHLRAASWGAIPQKGEPAHWDSSSTDDPSTVVPKMPDAGLPPHFDETPRRQPRNPNIDTPPDEDLGIGRSGEIHKPRRCCESTVRWTS